MFITVGFNINAMVTCITHTTLATIHSLLPSYIGHVLYNWAEGYAYMYMHLEIKFTSGVNNC